MLAFALALTACVAPSQQRLPLPTRNMEAAVSGNRVVAERLPVVLVHGLDDSPRAFWAMKRRLNRDGFSQVSAVRLTPNNGAVPLEALAEQLQAHVEQVRRETGSDRVDVVGFSMGALVSRIWMLEQGGRHHVRRLVSISGPHAGTATGWLRGNAGAAQMRWNSPLLQRLPNEAKDFAPAEVFSLWSPLDLMIIPAHSSRVPGARERTFPVLLHPLMLFDGRVLRSVSEALSVEHADDFRSEPPARAPPWP